jgi:hypothetical protein
MPTDTELALTQFAFEATYIASTVIQKSRVLEGARRQVFFVKGTSSRISPFRGLLDASSGFWWKNVF